MRAVFGVPREAVLTQMQEDIFDVVEKRLIIFRSATVSVLAKV